MKRTVAKEITTVMDRRFWFLILLMIKQKLRSWIKIFNPFPRISISDEAVFLVFDISHQRSLKDRFKGLMNLTNNLFVDELDIEVEYKANWLLSLLRRFCGACCVKITTFLRKLCFFITLPYESDQQNRTFHDLFLIGSVASVYKWCVKPVNTC